MMIRTSARRDFAQKASSYAFAVNSIVSAFLALCAIAVAAGCVAMTPGDRERGAAARAEVYDRPREEVMRAMLTILSQRYRIDRVVENHGFIETQWMPISRSGANFSIRVLATISEERPFRVRFQGFADRIDVSSAWYPGVVGECEDELYVALSDQLGRHPERTGGTTP